MDQCKCGIIDDLKDGLCVECFESVKTTKDDIIDIAIRKADQLREAKALRSKQAYSFTMGVLNKLR